MSSDPCEQARDDQIEAARLATYTQYRSGKSRATLKRISQRLAREDRQVFEVCPPTQEDWPDDVRGYWVFLSGSGGRGQLVEFKNVCDHCEEVMLLAWGRYCPICSRRMRRVFPGPAMLVNGSTTYGNNG